MRLLIAALMVSSLAFGDGWFTAPRSNKTFRFDAATSNVLSTPNGSVSSLVLSTVGNAQHLVICSESTARLRVNWKSGLPLSAPAPAAYSGIIPAAAASSFVCKSWDDVQISSTVYIWPDAGTPITTGLIYGETW